MYIKSQKKCYFVWVYSRPRNKFIMGTYETEARAEEVINEILEAFDRGEKNYTMPED